MTEFWPLTNLVHNTVNAQGSGVEHVMHTAASKKSCTIFSSKAATAGEERG